MEIIEYFTCDNKNHWLNELGKCNWPAGKFLCNLITKNKIYETLGTNTIIPMLVDGQNLVSFCTLAKWDEIQPTKLTPWIGFVYTYPEYRGHHYAGMLLKYAESIAGIMGMEYVYISTDHIGLYEKYGYEFFEIAKTINDEESKIYRKSLKECDKKYGDIEKAKIVSYWKNNTEQIAYCGFSCNHCFLGKWCGGCRSNFNVCSYSTCFNDGNCPNAMCAKKKKIDGCYNCSEILSCNVGFYGSGNDSIACKAQAIFIAKHGKEALINILNELHKNYDFKKIQEILGVDLEKALEILESEYIKLQK